MSGVITTKTLRGMSKDELVQVVQWAQNQMSLAQQNVLKCSDSLQLTIYEKEVNEYRRLLQAAYQHLMRSTRQAKYENDPASFVRNECKIFNPELDPAVVPFDLYPYQEQFLQDLYESYKNEQDVLDEKTRQMGLSWLYMAFFLWGLLYDASFTGFAMSYKESLVDDGGRESTVDSLFGKLRFMYEHLEEPLHELKFKFLRVTNPDTGAYVIGESTNPNAGRGGTYKIGLWDETASTPKSEVIFQAFHQAVKCRCFNSTARGKGNVFARLRWDPTSGVAVKTLHWTLHPIKGKDKKLVNGKWTSPWYEQECRELTPTQIAQELDIDYEASVEGRIWGKLSREVHLKKVDFDPLWVDRSIIAWDLGVADETFGVVMQMDNQGGIAIVDEVVGTDQDIRFYISLICGVEPPELAFLPKPQRDHFKTFLENSRKYQYWRLLNVAGPDAVQRSVTSKRSVREQFLHAGDLARDEQGKLVDRRFRNLRMIALTGYKVMDRIVAVKKVIDPERNHVVISDRCVNLWERLMNYHWSLDREGGNKETPEHDWASHGSDAFGYGILFLTRKKEVLQKPEFGKGVIRTTRPKIFTPMRVGR